MSSFAVDGLISGLKTTDVVSQLMKLERMPQQRLQATLGTQTSSVTAYQSIATRLKAVETAITALSGPAAWGARAVAVTGTSLTATAAPGAVAGQSVVEVRALASAATWTAAAPAGLDSAVISAAPPTLAIRTATGAAVTVAPTSGSMRDVMDAINKVPDSGLTAVAVKVGPDAYRLQIRATATGSAAQAAYLSGLDATPAPVLGADAQYSVGGMSGTSPTNTVTDLLPGVSVTFTQPGTSTVAVASDPGTTSAAVKAVVDEVNKVLDEMSKYTLAGGAGGARGVLAGDAGARRLADNLLSAVSSALGEDVAAQVGIQTTKQGRLAFDAEKFTAAYAADPTLARRLISPAEGGVSIASRLTGVIKAATDPVTGEITNAIQGRERVVKDLQKQIEGWDRRLDIRQATLNAQFKGMEVALLRIQSQGSWLSSQLGQSASRS